MEEYETVQEKRSKQRKDRRLRAIKKVAKVNKTKQVCAICGCPHIEILQFGHPNGDGAYHRREIGDSLSIVSWILNSPRQVVANKIQLECPYCNTWHAVNSEYPTEDKRPQWR